VSSYDGIALDAPRIRRRAGASSRWLPVVRTSAVVVAWTASAAVFVVGAVVGGPGVLVSSIGLLALLVGFAVTALASASADRTAARVLAEQLDAASWDGVHLDGAHRGGTHL
jgi:hypothetical protein